MVAASPVEGIDAPGDSHLGDAADARRARRRPGENRERLIVAGIGEFGTHGYHGTSTTAVAALAGVPQPHVYANFKTKQELFLACAARVVDALGDEPADADRLGGAVRGRARLYSDFLFQGFAAASDPKLQPELGECLRRLRDRIGQEAVLRLIASSAAKTLAED